MHDLEPVELEHLSSWNLLGRNTCRVGTFRAGTPVALETVELERELGHLSSWITCRVGTPVELERLSC